MQSYIQARPGKGEAHEKLTNQKTKQNKFDLLQAF